jgi:hypothetical protein
MQRRCAMLYQKIFRGICSEGKIGMGSITAQDQGAGRRSFWQQFSFHEAHLAQRTNRMNFDTDIELVTKPPGVAGCQYLNCPSILKMSLKPAR